MASGQVGKLLGVLREGKLLEPEQLDELERDADRRFPEARDLARELVKRGWMTAYQINQIAQGKARELSLGTYVLVERLGEGAMGQVFKARHRKLDRIVALKIIRKERLKSTNAVQRFQREARAVAKLSHPNIVAVYDADEVAGTHFMAMEFVDGIDLARLVKESGPLPAGKACEYVRQAAVGLQHAHEKGLVHRDIKPHNLLLSKSNESGIQASPASGVNGHASSHRAVVKVLDMGLARLSASDTDPNAGAMTQEGAVMGTPEYLAPEQARDARSVDIRADVYSLGCTLYFLLSGRPPYRGASLADTLLMHQLNEAPALAGVPAELQAVVSRMMAKKPEDRYQTPAEAAMALAPFCTESGGADTIWSATMPPSGDPSLATRALSNTLASASGDVRSFGGGSGKRWAGLAIGAVVVVLVAMVAFSRPSKNPEPGADKDQVAAVDQGNEDKRADAPLKDRPPSDRPADKMTEPPGKLEFPPDRWVDVLPFVNPDWHAVLGDWVKNKAGELELVSPSRGKPPIAVPMFPGGQYELRVSFTKNRGNNGVFFTLPLADHHCRVVFGGMGGEVNGLENISGRSIEDNSSTFKRTTVKLGTRHTVDIRVRWGAGKKASDVSASFDELAGRKLFGGPVADLDLPKSYTAPVDGLVLLGCDDGTIVFHAIEARRTGKREFMEIRPFDERPTVLAVFQHRAEKNNYLTKYYSNGRLDHPLSPFTWTLEGKTLIRHLGDRKNTCELSADGKTYQGTNTEGKEVSGELVSGSLSKK